MVRLNKGSIKENDVLFEIENIENLKWTEQDQKILDETILWWNKLKNKS